MQQLRGREGARVRSVYRKYAKENGIKWDKRTYDPKDFDGGDVINKALSAANVSLYGLAYSVIVALGISPGLGFIHVNHELSLVYDLADLYKAESSIKVAFEIASTADESEDIGRLARQKMRDYFVDGRIIKMMVRDLQYIFDVDEYFDADIINLWDDKEGLVEHGVNYSLRD